MAQQPMSVEEFKNTDFLEDNSSIRNRIHLAKKRLESGLEPEDFVKIGKTDDDEIINNNVFPIVNDLQRNICENQTDEEDLISQINKLAETESPVEPKKPEPSEDLYMPDSEPLEFSDDDTPHSNVYINHVDNIHIHFH